MRKLPDAHVSEGEHKGFRVHPAEAVVWRDAGFDFFNVTSDWVTLQFPEGVLAPDAEVSKLLETFRQLFPAMPADLLAGAVRRVGPGLPLHVDFAASAPHMVRYGVTVHTKDGPVDAPGGSAPKIIIVP